MTADLAALIRMNGDRRFGLAPPDRHHLAQTAHRMMIFLAANEGVPYRDSLAKYAAASSTDHRNTFCSNVKQEVLRYGKHSSQARAAVSRAMIACAVFVCQRCGAQSPKGIAPNVG